MIERTYGTLLDGAAADIARRLGDFGRTRGASGPLSGHGG